MLVLTNEKGHEVRYIQDQYKIDVDLNDSKDFEITIPSSAWMNDIKDGCRVFVPDTEYGGIIGNIHISTSETEIKRGGTTWRGFIQNKIIIPTGDYKTVSGELNSVITSLFAEYDLNLFSVSTTSTGVSVSNYQFARYTNLYDGLVKMLESVGYRFSIRYVQSEQGASGYVSVEAVPIVDRSEEIELSQNQQLNFSFDNEVNKCNHLICLGRGELSARQVIHLYIQQDGTVGDTKYYTGLNEVVQIYENANVEGDTTVEQLANLRKSGIDKLLEITNKSTFKMDLSALELDIDIGDIVGGRDYITGLSMKQPVWDKIYTEENGQSKVEYKLKGDDNKQETIVQ